MKRAAAGRVVVVTGSNEGIGHQLTIALLEAGYRVAGLDVATDHLRELTSTYPDRLRVHDCDVTSDDDVEAAVEAVLAEWGGIDVLVNNAAVFEFAPFLRQTEADTRREFEVNYFGYVRTIRAVLPHMLERGEGLIHNVCSGVDQSGHPGLSGYASTKGAVAALTRSLQLELRDDPVAVTLLYPPLTNTRQAAELDYPRRLLADPADVGRKLAEAIESRERTVYADLQTRVGMAVARLFPGVVRRGTARFVEPQAPGVESR